MDSWFLDPSDKYGGTLAVRQPASSAPTGLEAVAPVPTAGLAGFTTPDHPMFWFGIIGLVAVGCMAYSTLDKIV